MAEVPETVIECDGCGNSLNLLAPYLSVGLKPQHNVLLMSDEPNEDDPDGVPVQKISLGARKGRGFLGRFHDFSCLHKWVGKRKELKPKLEYHKEDEIYEPEDNRSPAELVESGEMRAAVARAIDTKPAEGGEE